MQWSVWLRISSAFALVAATALPCSAADHVIALKGMTYQPAIVNAKVGDTLRFVNDDGVEHEVFVPTKGFGTDLGMQKPTVVTELKLTKPGTFEVECVVHPHMLLKVTVSR